MTTFQPELVQPQLFLDDTWIEDSYWATRTWHQPRKTPVPVLTLEKPWEGNGPVAYGTVLHWRGKFRMWYMGWAAQPHPMVLYAESDDGYRWTRPGLGLHEWQGSTDNNIVMSIGRLIDDVAVIDDPDDAEWPLKALYWTRFHPKMDPQADRLVALRSKDGIRWEKVQDVLPGWGDRFNAMASKHRGKYVVYGREPGSWRGKFGSKVRTVSRTESDDLVHWSEPRLILTTDLDDPLNMETYSLTAFPYGDWLLGALERMHTTPDQLDVELVFSRDGTNWKRSPTRPAFLSWGPEPGIDSRWINLPTNGPIRRGNELWFYYSARSGAHSAKAPNVIAGIGLATMRLDGFCSIRTGERPGFVKLRPMTWPGGDLLVNVDARRDLHSHFGFSYGQFTLEVRDERDQPIDGYRLADCTPIHSNTARLPDCVTAVRWAGDKSLDDLKGRTLRLYAEMRDAHWYSFRAGTLAT